VNPGYLVVIFEPANEIRFDKLWDASDGWIPDVKISEQNVCYLNFTFVPRECWLLGYSEPAIEIRTL
jgi:hypothetical protein